MILYGNELSLTLLKNGVSQFIQEGRNQSIEEYKTALNDVIICKDFNRTNIELLFEDIRRHLEKNITKINGLKGKKIDYEALISGIELIGLGIVLTYATYYTHINYYQANRNEYKEIIKYLEDNRVKVEDRGNIYLTGPYEKSYYEKGKQLLKLNESEKEIVGIECLELALVFHAYFFGAKAIFMAFNPHEENQYLEKYEEMLAIIIELQEKYSASNPFPSLFKI